MWLCFLGNLAFLVSVSSRRNELDWGGKTAQGQLAGEMGGICT